MITRFQTPTTHSAHLGKLSRTKQMRCHACTDQCTEHLFNNLNKFKSTKTVYLTKYI